MSIEKIRPMPPTGKAWVSPEPLPRTPQCTSSVQVIGKHALRWRQNKYKEEWNRCTRPSTVVLDGAPLCRRHAGERVLEQYLEGKLIKRPT